MKKRNIIISALIFASIILQSGCSGIDSKQTITENIQTQEGQNQEAPNYIIEFENLIEKDASVNEVIDFLDKSVSSVSMEDASKMVIQLEEVHKNSISKLEEKIYKQEIQTKFIKEQSLGSNINNAEDIEDEGLKELVKEINNSGYKIETAEGMYFPIINYEFYKKYSEFVTTDIKEYIEIMSTESNYVPTKDAAFVISWDEIIKRAVRQEQFINAFSDSAKVNDVKNLYKIYVTYVIYGVNNTPLFSYDTKIINQEAKAAYISASKTSNDSRLLGKLNEFLELLENNKYKLTDKVEKFRKNTTDYLTDSTLV